MPRETFRTLLLQALRQFAETGYTSEADLQEWLLRLHTLLERELPSDEESRKQLAAALETVFKREVNRGGIEKRVQGADRYMIERVMPSLRAELDKRIFAGVDLIRLNKAAATQKTLQRFSGWVTSLPPGGAEVNVRDVARDVLKPSAEVKFQRRRVAIDQGHKLGAAVAHVVAEGTGAIAAIWHDRGQYDRGYDARPEHLKRSGTLFLVRDSWALNEGLIKRGKVQYTDEVEHVAELPFCSCWYEYITSPRSLPVDLFTAKGRMWLRNPSKALYDSAPTLAQQHAGNYRKGHIRVAGLDISIETARGEERTGIGKDGRPWSVTMPADYGYIRRTVGADDEHLDCYVGSNLEAPSVWIVRQADLDTGEFDEEKVLLGFNSRAEAVTAYVHGFSDGRGQYRIQSVAEMPIAEFRNYARATFVV